MSLATHGFMSRKWQNSAARRRCHAKFRRHLCRLAKCPIDSCFTTGELLASLRYERQMNHIRSLKFNEVRS